jgi:hypothetical protein
MSNIREKLTRRQFELLGEENINIDSLVYISGERSSHSHDVASEAWISDCLWLIFVNEDRESEAQFIRYIIGTDKDDAELILRYCDISIWYLG